MFVYFPLSKLSRHKLHQITIDHRYRCKAVQLPFMTHCLSSRRISIAQPKGIRDDITPSPYLLCQPSRQSHRLRQQTGAVTEGLVWPKAKRSGAGRCTCERDDGFGPEAMGTAAYSKISKQRPSSTATTVSRPDLLLTLPTILRASERSPFNQAGICEELSTLLQICSDPKHQIDFKVYSLET